VWLSLALAGGITGVLFTLMQSPVYKARASVEVQDVNQEFLNIKNLSPIGDAKSFNGTTDLQTQTQILQSASLIRQTLGKLNVSSLSELNPRTAPIRSWSSDDGKSAPGKLVQAAARHLKVGIAGQTRIIEVTFESTDPRMATGFANTLISEFIEQNMNARWQLSQRTSAWLGQQLDDLRSNLRRSDDALQSYARNKSLIYTGDRENVSTEKLRQLQSEMSRAQADRAVAESRFKVATTTAPETLADVLKDGNLRALQSTINELKRQAAEMAIIFKPDYVKAKQVRAELGATEAALEQERSAVVRRIMNDYKEAEHREAILAAAYEKQVGLVMQDSRNSIQYDILKREVDTNRQIYEATLERVKESSIANALRASNIRVVDSATVPDKPDNPAMPVNVAGGALFGLVLGFGTALARERVRESLNHPGDANRLLGLPELGVIPRAGRSTGRLPVTMAAKPAGPGLLSGAERLPAWQHMSGGTADGFRAVMASILFAVDSTAQKVLVITSAGPDEGKTTAAANLAVALAQIGHKVLLIDGDIRNPRMHKIFDIANETGLTELLSGASSARPAESLRSTNVPLLQVLTSGPPVPAGADLFFSKAMQELLSFYRPRFDIIILDSPPLLHMPDARVLGRVADAVVLVARAGRTMRDAIVAAVERLTQDRTKILGIILNDWKPGSSPDAYYGNYKRATLKAYSGTR
jgi:capsular exopolysaccharide synthesis family protein